MKNSYEALVLFSGGLDSILAAKILLERGVKTACLHFTSPFFGDAGKISRWRDLYGLDVFTADATGEFMAMLAAGPEHGFGKALNPCVDCKILLLRKAKKMLADFGASFLATGEVLGQRPMSQRKDSMNLIAREADARDVLLRPLCARILQTFPSAAAGSLKKEDFPGISGRGRSEQLALAEKFGLREIPTPAGGCLLTEKENTRRYWHILKKWRSNGDMGDQASLRRLGEDMALAAHGRQFWHDDYWFCLGRNKNDNAKLAAAMRKGDALLRLASHPGPIGLARNGGAWPREILEKAAAMLASYSPRAAANASAACEIQDGSRVLRMEAAPMRDENFWTSPGWEETRAELALERKRGPEKK